ncbi:putative DNA-binding domain-containing protein [Marinobacterium rhizophilum]|uniref:HvfC/BufC family peptide modification chaperone n=1 Tax=Marinobacterium rhizophilum TaxID=420402 RepID=UPI00036B330A|nr:putative DNA-binding domain-containing protein [Marinobacterium rhizophilum]
MHLADLQTALRAELDGHPNAELRQLITSASLAPEQCLQLYRDLLAKTRTRALAQLYPVTAQLLGPQLFHALSQQYGHHLVDTGTVEPFGTGLASLLKHCTDSQSTLQNLQFLPELASLEWARNLAWTAEEDPPQDFDSLIYVPESEQYRLRLVASQALQLLRCHWPVLDIWNNYQHDHPGKLHLRYRAHWLCVYRHLDSPRAETLSDSLGRLLKGILQGHTLYQLSREVPDLNQHLTLLISRRWITHVELPPDSSS